MADKKAEPQFKSVAHWHAQQKKAQAKFAAKQKGKPDVPKK